MGYRAIVTSTPATLWCCPPRTLPWLVRKIDKTRDAGLAAAEVGGPGIGKGVGGWSYPQRVTDGETAEKVGQAAERARRIRLLTEMARTMLVAGANEDQIARELLRRTDSPISAIKAVANATGMNLGDAKWVVHRNLDPEVREAAEALWRDLLDGLAQFEELPDEPDPDR